MDYIFIGLSSNALSFLSNELGTKDLIEISLSSKVSGREFHNQELLDFIISEDKIYEEGVQCSLFVKEKEIGFVFTALKERNTEKFIEETLWSFEEMEEVKNEHL